MEVANTNTARLTLSVGASEKADAVFGSSAKWGGEIDVSAFLGNGVAAGGYDLLYMGERSVASGADDDIDVAGVLTSPLGESFAAVELVAVVIINAPKSGVANTTVLTVGGPTSAGTPVAAYTNPGRPISPGGFFAEFSPGAAGLGASGVTASTGDKLRVSNSAGATANYQIALLARTA
jgi:hypothetical protein